MVTVLVNGATSPLGRRLAALVDSDPDVDSVVSVDGGSLARRALAPWSEPLDVIVLAPSHGPDHDGSTIGGVDLDGATRLMEELTGREVRRVVVLSSAMVYGAWPDNPIPLTEDAVLRPNAGCRFAADKAELERRMAEWRSERPETSVAVLRPALTVSPDVRAVEWMEASLWHAPTARHGDADPPGQFLALEDLVAALAHARRLGLDGAFNVGPQGWLSSDRQVELSGRGGRLRIPAAIVAGVAAWRWRLQLTSTPPDVVPYTMHPWVIASDRLRATGWQPTLSNDEAFVMGHRSGWWSALTARRRQDFALGLLVLGSVGLLAGALWLIRRLTRAERA